FSVDQHQLTALLERQQVPLRRLGEGVDAEILLRRHALEEGRSMLGVVLGCCRQAQVGVTHLQVLPERRAVEVDGQCLQRVDIVRNGPQDEVHVRAEADRKSTRLNSSHVKISYAVFCLK